MTSAEPVPIFFYGLFMDVAVLRSKGLSPGAAQVATVRDHAVRLAGKALLLPTPGQSAQGVLVTLTRPEIDQLYAGAPGYREIRLSVTLADGSTGAAIAMVHAEPPLDAPLDEAYAAAWRALVGRLGLRPAADGASRC